MNKNKKVFYRLFNFRRAKGGRTMYIDLIERTNNEEAAFARLYPEDYNKICEAREKELPEQVLLKQGIKNFFNTMVLFKNWLRNLFLKK